MSSQAIINLCEAVMIVCFGLSWPISIRKSYKSRTAKGKSLVFEIFIEIGYIFGIIMKALQFSNGAGGALFFLAWAFYVLNFCEILIDIGLYMRNRKLDKLNSESREQSAFGAHR